jgi:acylphosphatase
MKHISIRVSGNVQGVFFRASTKNIAEKFDIRGFVRNEQDGSVYIEAEGSDENLKQFVDWCHHGPVHAIVDNVVLTEGVVYGFTGFEIKR